MQLQTGSGAIPLLLGLVSSNYKGVTKKMTVSAVIFIIYCAGNIAGPQTFKSTEAKRWAAYVLPVILKYTDNFEGVIPRPLRQFSYATVSSYFLLLDLELTWQPSISQEIRVRVMRQLNRMLFPIRESSRLSTMRTLRTWRRWDLDIVCNPVKDNYYSKQLLLSVTNWTHRAGEKYEIGLQ